MPFRYPFPNLHSARRLATWLIVAGAVGCTAQAREKDPAGPSAPPPAAAGKTIVSVKADAPQAPREERTATALELAGDLRPDQSADLGFKIGGQLLSVRVKRGERVKRGQVLATLAATEARAQLAQTDAAVAQARAQVELAHDNEARASSLVAANAAPGSQATAVKLQSRIAEAALLQAGAARDLANATLNNHELVAPFDGEVVKVPDGAGSIVTPGTLLFRLESLDKLVLRTTVSENDVDRIKVGDDVQIESLGKKVKGTVRLVLRSLEASSRRAPVEVAVPNESRSLIAGSYVRATLQTR
jgi:membrane fusion protein, multidrug efflux system